MSFFAILWSIWLARNDIIFNAGCFDQCKLMGLIKWRLAMWCKVKWLDIVDSLEDFVHCPHLVKIQSRCFSARRGISWFPPDGDSFKFNADGSEIG